MKLLQSFNREESVLVISDYPEKTKKGEKNYGIAWHTKELVKPISQKYGIKHVILAEKGLDNEPKTYENGQVLVLRVFDQTHPTLFPRILRWLWFFRKIKQVHIHSEFFVNGGLKNFVLLIPFILLIKMTGKQITYYAHNVVLDLKSFAGHLNLNNTFVLWLFSLAMRWYYILLSTMVSQFVVMDGAIQKRLSHYIPWARIFLQPFAVKKTSYPLSHEEAKRKLKYSKKDYVLVSFGFVSHYKGADWIIKMVQKLRKEKQFRSLKLILAGGEAYSQRHKKHYQAYYRRLQEAVACDPAIRITGFVPEDEIGLYFTAADLIVLPYRGLIGGSGTFVHALSYRKQFLLSSHMSELLESSDIQQALMREGLHTEDVTFTYSHNSLKEAVLRMQKGGVEEKVQRSLVHIARARRYNELVGLCYRQLYQPYEQKEKSYSVFGKFKLSGA